MLPQAGGHQLLKVKGTSVIKPTKLSEVEFYKTYLPKYPQLHKFLPKFYSYGLTSDIKDMYTQDEYNMIQTKQYTHYIELENLVLKNNVDIIDLKLGSIHWLSTATQKDIDATKTRNKLSIIDNYKFRLDGAIVDNVKYEKELCRNMTIREVTNVLKQIKNLHKLKEWIDELLLVLPSIDLNIYGPSILLVVNDDYVNIKLIDFTSYEELSDKMDDLVEALKIISLFIVSI